MCSSDLGECWDLIAQALDDNNATWDGRYTFGLAVSMDSRCVYPGDIVQFKNVVISYEVGNNRFIETYKHHTAIVDEVLSNGCWVLLHQNTSEFGRRVDRSSICLHHLKKGKIKVYRPQL